MKLHILFGQRKCQYEGQYAPEALEIADQYTMDQNPSWLRSKKEHDYARGGFESLAIIVVKVPNHIIDYALVPKVIEVDGVIVKK